MPRFLPFLQENTGFAAAALKCMKQSIDRFTNAFQELGVTVEIPGLEACTRQYVKILSEAKFSEQQNEDGTPILHPSDQNQVKSLIRQLIQVTCNEMLDEEGNLHPVLCETLNLTEEQKNSYRDKMAKGFAHYVFAEIIPSPIFQSMLTRQLSEDVDRFTKMQTCVDEMIRATLREQMQYGIQYCINARQLSELFGAQSPVVQNGLSNAELAQSKNLKEYCRNSTTDYVTNIMLNTMKFIDKYPDQVTHHYPRLKQIIDSHLDKLFAQFKNMFPDFDTIKSCLNDLSTEINRAEETLGKDNLFNFTKPTDPLIAAMRKDLELLKQSAQLLHKLQNTPAVTIHLGAKK